MCIFDFQNYKKNGVDYTQKGCEKVTNKSISTASNYFFKHISLTMSTS